MIEATGIQNISVVYMQYTSPKTFCVCSGSSLTSLLIIERERGREGGIEREGGGRERERGRGEGERERERTQYADWTYCFPKLL